MQTSPGAHPTPATEWESELSAEVKRIRPRSWTLPPIQERGEEWVGLHHHSSKYLHGVYWDKFTARISYISIKVAGRSVSVSARSFLPYGELVAAILCEMLHLSGCHLVCDVTFEWPPSCMRCCIWVAAILCENLHLSSRHLVCDVTFHTRSTVMKGWSQNTSVSSPANTYVQWRYQMLYNTIWPLDDGHIVLETCRGI